MQDLNVVLVVLGVVVTGIYLRYNQPGKPQEMSDNSSYPVGLAGNDIPEQKICLFFNMSRLTSASDTEKP